MRSPTSLVRFGLPAVIALAGAILIVAGVADLGIGLILAALLVLVANWYIRLSIGSQDDRADEDAARREFERTGRWPPE